MISLLYIQTARQALMSNKLRSFLTMLGIVIGIAAIVIIISVGSGAQSLIINQINTLGSNIIGVLPGNSDEKGPPATAFGITITSLVNDDIDAIARDAHGVAGIAGYSKGVGTISWDSQSVESTFTGTTADYIRVEDTTLAEGEFFTQEDDESLSRVAVLGWGVYEDLFGDQNAIGEKIKIRRETFRVIGVLGKRGTAAFQNQDDQVFIPLLTAQKIMLGVNYLGFMRIKADDSADLDALAEEIRVILRSQHDIGHTTPDDFSVRTTKQALDILGNITNILKYFLAAISAVSLFVGGIGIMNIMLVAVLERTREIGLRKAVGARPGDLRQQFLFETVMITLLGGIVGLAIGVIVSFLISLVVQALGYAWDFIISPVSLILSVVFPLAVGLLFGFYPAQKASQLKPIEALHYE